MNKLNLIIIMQICACLVLGIGTFVDESAQVLFALKLANKASFVSTLLSAGLIGGILGGLIVSLILQSIGYARTITWVFIIQGVMIGGASIVTEFWSYVIVALALGCAGSVLWSSVLVAVPDFAKTDKQLDYINRVIQSVRNLGYIGGPLLGSIIYGVSGGVKGLFYLSWIVFFASLVSYIFFRFSGFNKKNPTNTSNKKKPLDVLGLLKTKNVLFALLPLIFTVIFTSSLNVLMIIRIRSDLHLSAESYGLVVSSLSIGLVLGPLFITGIFRRFGNASGASMAASMIGFGIFSFALTDNLKLMILSTFILGIANGVQNALMSTFMMKTIDENSRQTQMPAYVLILQTSVFIGFLGAGFVESGSAQITLLFIGLLTIIVGLIGFICNLYTKEKV